MNNKPSINTFTFDWTTREGYFAWRAEWKEKYQAISTAIRNYRHCRSKYQSAVAKKEDTTQSLEAFRKAETELGKAIANGFYTPRPYFDLNSQAKDCARYLLELRKASKIEAGRQRQAALTQEIPPITE